uniref:Heme lyase n=1 Tax=Nitella hyalina TaxID=181804 RepID=H9LR15_NITHY|nr:heme lyase [Nitella hyalina]AEH42846.1 heme lyase [Nitella hyalina]
MYVEIGHYFFILSIFVALAYKKKNIFFFFSLYFLLLTICFFSFLFCYVSSDFSIYSVFTNSNNQLPLFYKVSGTWSNHEGSLLLWCWILSLYGFLFCFRTRNFVALTGAPLMIHKWIALFFSLFLCLTSNPFLRISFLSTDSGKEFNPVLQDPVLAIHPPCIYAGYVASTIGFCLCVSGFTQKKHTAREINESGKLKDHCGKRKAVILRSVLGTIRRPLGSAYWKLIRIWILTCWCFLTVGILLGSWWAYHELGWGGWWFWDPVENASLMPWVLATACIHSVISFRLNSWTFFLNIVTFLLSILGTFFVRSGLLASVHSFATDSQRGIFLLSFFLLASLSLVLFKKNRTTGAYDHLSEIEQILKLQLTLLCIICLVVLCGTAAPVLFHLLAQREVSTGAPFFNGTIIPLFICLLLVLVYIHYRSAQQAHSNHSVFFCVLFIIHVIFIKLIADLSYLESFCCALCFSLFLSFFLFKPSAPMNMILSHGGVCILITGVILSNTKKIQITQIMHFGFEQNIGNGRLCCLRSIDQLHGPTFQSICGNIACLSNHDTKAAHHYFEKVISCERLQSNITFSDLTRSVDSFVMFPEKRFCFSNPETSTTKVAIHTNFFTDLYALIGTGSFETGWYTTIMKLPFIFCIWIGFVLASFGGFRSLIRQLSKQKLNWN